MWQRAFALLLVSLILLAGCGGLTRPSPDPPVTAPPNPPDVSLTPIRHRHFTIAVPEGWKVTTATDSGDQVILADPAQPEVSVSVFTFLLRNASREQLLGRWQFADRNPQPFQSPTGQEGFLAEGPLSTDAARQVLALGYWGDGAYEQIVQAAAPKEQFGAMRDLFEQILRTHTPRPALDK